MEKSAEEIMSHMGSLGQVDQQATASAGVPTATKRTRIDAGYAFPQPQTITDGRAGHACDYGYGGMELRDWFAGQIITSLFANPNGWPMDADACEYARRAYLIADAMLAERSK